jgi:L-type amino acid transporter 13
VDAGRSRELLPYLQSSKSDSFPSMQWVISLGISTAILHATSSGILSTSRIFYSISQEGQLPLIYSTLNEHSCPVVAITQLSFYLLLL